MNLKRSPCKICTVQRKLTSNTTCICYGKQYDYYKNNNTTKTKKMELDVEIFLDNILEKNKSVQVDVYNF